MAGRSGGLAKRACERGGGWWGVAGQRLGVTAARWASGVPMARQTRGGGHAKAVYCLARGKVVCERGKARPQSREMQSLSPLFLLKLNNLAVHQDHNRHVTKWIVEGGWKFFEL